jgi:apolipoprotein N-acyltransferase
MDQFHWDNNSLDSAFTITEKMVRTAALNKPELIIGPESALLCYLERRPDLSSKVKSWANATNTPILLGALHWDKAQPGAPYEFNVYNSAFFIEPGSQNMEHYNKQKLVPFSEKMPFENLFPILSRVNLGEADFRSGDDPKIFSTRSKIKAVPFICYEIIFPSFVQQRLKMGANLIVTITNDGWFGKTSAPYQHATMARMRAIENKVSVVRCANSGISMFIDPFGRVLKKSELYTRAVMDGAVELKSADTFYSKYGDWFVSICLWVSAVGMAMALLVTTFKKKKVAD